MPFAIETTCSREYIGKELLEKIEGNESGEAKTEELIKEGKNEL